jgi:arylsulfatase A-like enzyme
MSTPRNVLFFFSDQQRLDLLGAYGNPLIRTPHLDALAARGTRFDRAFTCTAICSPARASLLTGMWPHNHHLLANLEANLGTPRTLSPRTPPFSRYLRDAGYNVGLEGKYHASEIGSLAEHGFDGELCNNWNEPIAQQGYRDYLRARGLPEFRPVELIRGVFPNGRPGKPIAGVYEGPVEGTFTYYLAEKAIERLRSYAADYHATGKPFHFSLHFFGPHMPYYLPRSYMNLYDPSKIPLPGAFDETFARKPAIQYQYHRHWCADHFSRDQWKHLIALYWGFMTLIDEQVGRVLAEIDRLGLRDSTAVLFSADHGSFEGNHRLNDKGPAMYDDIYRIPLLAHVPWLPAAPKTSDRFVSLIDLTPTFLELAGVPVPGNYDGESLLPGLRGEAPRHDRREIFAEFHGHHFPYSQRMIRTDRHKLVMNPADICELYDLELDPDELVNRIDEPAYAAVQKQLFTRLYRHVQATGDRLGYWMDSTYVMDHTNSTYDEKGLF